MDNISQIEQSARSILVQYGVAHDGILLTTFFTDEYERMEDLAHNNVHLYALRALGEFLEEKPSEATGPGWDEIVRAFEASKERELWEFNLRGADEYSEGERQRIH